MCHSKLFLCLKRLIPLLVSTLILSILITPTGAVVLAQDEEPEQPGEILPDVPDPTPEPLDEIPQPPEPRDAEGSFEGMDADLQPSNISTSVISIPYLVHDIYGGATGSNPEYMTVFNDKLFFGAYDSDPYVGRELWAYTGSGSPYRAADLWLGDKSSWPQPATSFKGWLFMAADTGDGKGTELTAWNGTTTRRYNIMPGSAGSYPRYMTVYDSNYASERLYFAANGGSTKGGTELWALNCIYCTPYRVADIWSGPKSSTPAYLEVYASQLWFSANGGNGKGRELWVYNGTGAPKMRADICSGSNSSNPTHLQVFGERMYFGADGCNGKGRELWSQYFNYASPGLTADILKGSGSSNPGWLEIFNNLLFFSADGGDGRGRELWAYNGSTAPVRAADIYPGGTSSNPTYLAAFKDRLYFSAVSNDGAGRELRAIYMGTQYLWWYSSVAAYDGWVLESSETSNAGGSINSSSSFFRLGDDGKDRQYRAILHFNTSGLPDNAVIIGASINIKKYNTVGTDPFTTHNKLMIDVRKGAFSGKLILQPSDFEASPSSWNAGGNTNNPPGSQWYSIPLTTPNFKYINKTGVTQFRLRFYRPDNDDMNADYINFISANAANAFNHPALNISYYIP